MAVEARIWEKNRRDKGIMAVETRIWEKNRRDKHIMAEETRIWGKEQKRQAYHGCRDKDLGKRTEETSISWL